jgi:hypothetical protein
MFDKVVGFFHILLTFLASIYFLFRNNNLDKYYILFFCIINLSWVFTKNDCAVSYIVKKLNDSNYKLGDNTRIEDYDAVIGPEASAVFIKYLLVMYVINILYIIYVSNIKTPLKVSLVGVLFSYTLYITSLKNEVEDMRPYQIINLLTNSAAVFLILV